MIMRKALFSLVAAAQEYTAVSGKKRVVAKARKMLHDWNGTPGTNHGQS